MAKIIKFEKVSSFASGLVKLKAICPFCHVEAVAYKANSLVSIMGDCDHLNIDKSSLATGAVFEEEKV